MKNQKIPGVLLACSIVAGCFGGNIVRGEEFEIYQEDFYGADEYNADVFLQEETISRNTEEENQVEDFEIRGREEAQEDFQQLFDGELPRFAYLDVPQVLQEPELPTGCESVALTMALLYEGFPLDKTTIADEFLIYNRESDNMALGYVGDPFSAQGAGCFAPAIAATAEAFFKDQEVSYAAYNITGTELEDLFYYVSTGTPVVVWSTMYMAEPEFTREDSEYDGQIYQWYLQEHCVLLTGYDLDEGTLQINDPLEGVITRDLEAFKRIYNLTGQGAVVLRELDEVNVSQQEAATEKIYVDAGIQ